MKSLNINCYGYPEREAADKESVLISVWPLGTTAIGTTLWFTVGEARHVINLLNEAIKQAEQVDAEEEQ